MLPVNHAEGERGLQEDDGSCANIARGAGPKLKWHPVSVIAGSRQLRSVMRRTGKCDVVEIWPMCSA